MSIAADLATSAVLDARYEDHPLAGTWKHHRECHLSPDLLLVYRYKDADSLILVRLGILIVLFG